MREKKLRLALVAVALATHVGCTMNRDAAKQSYLHNGNRLFDSGSWDDASLNYRKAIEKDPQFGEAYYKLGLSESRRGEFEEGTRALTRAAQLLPARDNVKVALANDSLTLCLRNDSWPACEAAGQALSQVRQQDTFDVLRIKGLLAMVDRKPDEAREYLGRANTLKPMQPDVVHAYTEALIQGTPAQREQGEALAVALVKAHPEFLPIYDVLYSRYWMTRRFAEAERILVERVRNNPGEPSALTGLASHYARSGNQQAMNAVIDRMVANSAFTDRFVRAGDFYRSINQPDRAIAMYDRGLREQSADLVSYNRRIITVLQSQGKFDEAIKRIDMLLAAHPDEPELNYSKAELLVKEGGSESLGQAVQILKHLLRKENRADFHYLLGQIFCLQGDSDRAEKEFLEAAKKTAYVEPLLALAGLELRRKDYRTALHYADRVLQYSPLDARGRLLRAKALREKGDFDEAGIELSSLAEDYPASLEPALELGNLRLAQGRFKEAETLFATRNTAAGGDLRSFDGLVQTYFAEKQPEKAVRLLNALGSDPSTAPERHLRVADAAMAAQDFPLAIAQYACVSAAQPQWTYVHLRWGDALLKTGRLNDAITQFQAAYDGPGDRTQAAAMLALAYDRANRKKDAIGMYRELLKAQPDNVAALNNLALLLADTGGDLAQALALAEHAEKEAPGDPRISDTVGWIYLKKRVLDAAVAVFSKDVSLAPHDPVYRYHLALALDEKGEPVLAKKYLTAALADNPPKEDARNIRDLLSRIRSGAERTGTVNPD
ncbi:MAG: tetratricopeptide repeat protein [Acidobacteriaceae bacterium]|nr:tetratricopeptide repeat protein [Acidobacteriaceae bacterium]